MAGVGGVSEQVERELVGYLARKPAAWFSLLGIVSAGDFASPIYGDLFRAIGVCVQRTSSVTPGMILSEWVVKPEGIPDFGLLSVLAHDAAEVSPRAHAVLIAEAAKRRRLEGVATDLAEFVRSTGGRADDVARSMIEKIMKAAGGAGGRRAFSMNELVRGAADAIMRTDPSIGVGLDPSIGAIREMTGPLVGGEMILLAGTSGSGKTALASQIIGAAARQRPALMVQGEMGSRQSGMRELLKTGIPSRRLREGDLSETDVENITQFAAAEHGRLVTIFRERPDGTDGGPISTVDIRAQALAMKAEFGDIAGIVCDHAKITVSGRKSKDIFEQIRYVAEDAKSIAKEVGCPFILLAQLKRGGREDHARAKRIEELRPREDDIYGGHDIVENADLVLLLHRPSVPWARLEPKFGTPEHDEWSKTATRWRGRAELIMTKFRDGVGHKIAELGWNASDFRFEDSEPLPVEEDTLPF